MTQMNDDRRTHVGYPARDMSTLPTTRQWSISSHHYDDPRRQHHEQFRQAAMVSGVKMAASSYWQHPLVYLIILNERR